MFFGISRIVPFFGVSCTCFLLACALTDGPESRASPFEIHFLDVGQGDACLMRTPGNRWYLYDTGNKPEYLLPFLRGKQVDTLAAVFVSHTDLDHFGAFSALLREFPVKKAYLPPDSGILPQWRDLLAALDVSGTDSDTLFAGDTLIFEPGVHARALWPPPHTALQGNELSLVLRVEYRSRRVLLTGDIETEAERRLLHGGAMGPDGLSVAVPGLSTDILKVAHHGSRTSSGLPFLSAAGARWAVISCDSAVYGHPHPETLAGLDLVLGDDSRILRTDRDGTVGFALDGNGIRRID